MAQSPVIPMPMVLQQRFKSGRSAGFELGTSRHRLLQRPFFNQNSVSSLV